MLDYPMRRLSHPTRLLAALLAIFLLASGITHPASAADGVDLLRKENLVAWCIVPFDAARRGPAERAA
ncbi:MAG: hypothetical protein ACO1RT_14190, partial [Planctomycetaceae bacterium]